MVVSNSVSYVGGFAVEVWLLFVYLLAISQSIYPSNSLGRPDWTTHSFNVSAGINMKVWGNERTCIGVSGMVTYMGIGDHGLR